MNKKSEYIKPSYTDIDILKEVKTLEEELSKKFKDKSNCYLISQHLIFNFYNIFLG